MSKLDTIGHHKTAVYTDSNKDLCVRYHQTVVWRQHPNGRVTLNSGGWRTNTTKTRINQAFRQYGYPYQVVQKNFEWFVSGPAGSVPFTDGMTVG